MEERKGQKLILADGTEIENGRAGISSGFLWLWVPDRPFWDVGDTVRDPEKTAEITYQYGEMQDVYENYTDCTVLMVQENEIAVCLKRAEPEGNGGLNG